MFAVITTEEYKELLDEKRERDEYEQWFKEATEELKKTKEKLKQLEEEFNCLLRRITDGREVSKWEDGRFEPFDVTDRKVIADYINENYWEDGKLILKGE